MSETNFISTGVMCMITVNDPNSMDGIRQVDVGNYYTKDGENCVITDIETARKYHKYIKVPIYVTKQGEEVKDAF